MIFRPTQKLNARIKGKPLAPAPLDANPFADWSAHLFFAARTQYILLTNTKWLYSTVLYARGITGDEEFIDRALTSVRESLESDGMGSVYEQLVAPDSASVQFAKALNRSVTGSMNDLAKFAKFMLVEKDLAPFDVGVRLSDIPMTALATGGLSHGFPRRVFKAAAEEQGIPGQ